MEATAGPLGTLTTASPDERLDLGWQVVADAMGLDAETPPTVTPHRVRPGHGRTTEYRFDGGPHVFVKTYADAALGRSTHATLAALWAGDFGPDSPDRVSQPLLWRDDLHALVVAAVPGRCLADCVTGPPGDLEEGVRGAARWLARLHAQPLPATPSVPPPDEPRLARHDALVAGLVAAIREREPDLVGELELVLDVLAERAPTTAVPSVLAHGRYRAEHVFLDAGVVDAGVIDAGVIDAGVVTVIDLDRAGPRDPAVDVGEFVQRLRAVVVRGPFGPGEDDRLTEVFLTEYRERGGADLPNLAFAWSTSALRNLLAGMVKQRSESRLNYHRAEFHAVAARARRLLDLGGARADR